MKKIIMGAMILVVLGLVLTGCNKTTVEADNTQHLKGERIEVELPGIEGEANIWRFWDTSVSPSPVCYLAPSYGSNTNFSISCIK